VFFVVKNDFFGLVGQLGINHKEHKGRQGWVGCIGSTDTESGLFGFDYNLSIQLHG
jgi:hypothetical protein